MPDPKKSGVAFWATVVVVAVLVAYPLSFGPACWIVSRTNSDRSSAFQAAYRPLGWIVYSDDPVAARFLNAWAQVGLQKGSTVVIPGGPYRDGRQLTYFGW